MQALYEILLVAMISLNQFYDPNWQESYRSAANFSEKQNRLYFSDMCKRLQNQSIAEKVSPDQLLKIFDGAILLQKQLLLDAADEEKSYQSPAIFKIIEKEFGVPQLKFSDIKDFYTFVCTSSSKLSNAENINLITRAQNQAFAKYQQINSELPELPNLDRMTWTEVNQFVDANGKLVAEAFLKNGKRRFVPWNTISEVVVKAFLAAEDKDFFSHPGVNINGITRAASKVIVGSRLEGGSTISQQLVKNLVYLNQPRTISLKVKELLLTYKLENEQRYGFTKKERKEKILATYLNMVNMGKDISGIGLAAEKYFGKNVRDLDESEAAFLAGITRSPRLAEVEHRAESIERRNQVLSSMYTDADAAGRLFLDFLKIQSSTIVSDNATAVNNAEHFAQVARTELKKSTSEYSGLQVHLTLDSDIQKLVQSAFISGQLRYLRLTRHCDRPVQVGEVSSPKLDADCNNVRWSPLKNLFSRSSEVGDQSLESKISTMDLWLKRAENPYRGYKLDSIDNSQLEYALVIDQNHVRMGKENPKSYPLSFVRAAWRNQLKIGDIVLVHHVAGEQVTVLQVPEGAAMVMNPWSGHVLAQVGGSDHSLSSFNRATQARRQGGSTFKPFTYLAALEQGYAPNFLLSDVRNYQTQGGYCPDPKTKRAWYPQNYDRRSLPEPRPMFLGLMQSRNLMTANLMEMVGLKSVLELISDFGVVDQPTSYCSIVLGAQETTLERLVRAYARIANSGFMVNPTYIKSVYDSNQKKIIDNYSPNFERMRVDPIALFQLRYMLQAAYENTNANSEFPEGAVFGKTGTTDDAKSVWYVGGTNDFIVGAYFGFDDGISLLGSKISGQTLALPVFNEIAKAIYATKGLSATRMYNPESSYFDIQMVNTTTGELNSQNLESVAMPFRNPNSMIDVKLQYRYPIWPASTSQYYLPNNLRH